MSKRCGKPYVARCPNVEGGCDEPHGIDWSRLAPREAWEALNAAPKIAGPWGTTTRHHPSGLPVAWDDSFVNFRGEVTSRHVRVSSKFSPSGGVEYYPDRASADAALRAAGWVLVDDDAPADEKESGDG